MTGHYQDDQGALLFSTEKNEAELLTLPSHIRMESSWQPSVMLSDDVSTYLASKGWKWGGQAI